MVPIELYKFYNNSGSWFYTSADHDVVFEGNTYTSTTISRSEIEAKASVRRENLDITVAVNNPMGKDFMQYIPDSVTFVVLYIQSNVGTFIGWKGRLQATSPNKSTIKLTCESIYTSMQRVGLRQQYQRGCRHMLYDATGCRVDKNTHLVNAIVISCSAFRITFSASVGAIGFYTGGVIEYNGALRAIINHDGENTIDINDQFPALVKALVDNPGGVSVKLYPGCDRSKEMCTNRFGNFANFGGFPDIPLRNPMDGNSIV